MHDLIDSSFDVLFNLILQMLQRFAESGMYRTQTRNKIQSSLARYPRRSVANPSGRACFERQHVGAREQLVRRLASVAGTQVGKGRALPRDGADEGDEVSRRQPTALPLAKAGKEGVATA